MDLQSLIAKLHPLERAILPLLLRENTLAGLTVASKLQEVEVVRALQWLENKQAVKLASTTTKFVTLDKNGLIYKLQGLPERRLLKVLTDSYQPLSLLAKQANLTPEEVQASLGALKRKVAIELTKKELTTRGLTTGESTTGTELMAKLGVQGQKLLREQLAEEKFLGKNFPLAIEKLTEVDQLALAELQKRKEIVKVEERKLVTIQLLPLGKQLAQAKIEQNVVNRLTPAMLKTGSWKKQQFRAYDVEINVPTIFGGKKHFVTQAVEYARQIWLEMGFKEMTGNYVGTSFWNFDALFTAQDHPVRELQDTYYLGEPEKGKLPAEKLVKAVQAMHEHGGTIGSTGWRYRWDREDARRKVLRTHTTILSVQTLASLKNTDLPAKFFAIGKGFRNETADWSHLFEFNQTEGIVIDEQANFSHLLGYLREFARKMGYPKVRFRPAFFPYTEPSVEGDIYDPVHNKWVEFIAAGIFRPEVVVPLLGKDVPVLAWGPGIDRMITNSYGLTDIRDLYKNDVKQLREMPVWLK
ncbi:MAG: phenylalanine--tRNA ligase subunit alpha [Nanoarchaeota archaeon]